MWQLEAIGQLHSLTVLSLQIGQAHRQDCHFFVFYGIDMFEEYLPSIFHRAAFIWGLPHAYPVLDKHFLTDSFPDNYLLASL